MMKHDYFLLQFASWPRKRRTGLVVMTVAAVDDPQRHLLPLFSDDNREAVACNWKKYGFSFFLGFFQKIKRTETPGTL
jgi:hypothetical protein